MSANPLTMASATPIMPGNMSGYTGGGGAAGGGGAFAGIELQDKKGAQSRKSI